MLLDKYFPIDSFVYDSYTNSSPEYGLKITHVPTGESVNFNKDNLNIKGYCMIREYLKLKLIILVIDKYGLKLKY